MSRARAGRSRRPKSVAALCPSGRAIAWPSPGSHRQWRPAYEAQPGLVEEMLVAGTERVRAETQQTVELALNAIGLSATLKRMRRKVESCPPMTAQALPD